MNNSSDSENDNINKIKIDSQKKRGRPKKNLYLEKNTKSSDKKEITNDEKDIILHLPVFLPKNNKNIETNKFTTTTNHNNKNDTSLSLSENDESSDDNSEDFSDSDSESESEYDKYKKLYIQEQEENRKKDLLIKKLREDSSKKSSNIFDSEVQKDLRVHIIDMKFIDSNTNKLIENKKTDVSCWWCTYQFDNLPTYLPEKYSDGNFHVSGCFCSFNCAGAYNLSQADNKIWERYSLLKLLELKKLILGKINIHFKTVISFIRLNLTGYLILNLTGYLILDLTGYLNFHLFFG